MMKLVKTSRAISIIPILLLLISVISCDDEDTSTLIESEIVGEWEIKNSKVDQCSDESNNVSLRACDASDIDAVECGVFNFRSDGIFESEFNSGVEETYYLESNMVVIVSPNEFGEEDDIFEFEFSVSGNSLILINNEFNNEGCVLTMFFEKTN